LGEIPANRGRSPLFHRAIGNSLRLIYRCFGSLAS
jgi:hypothetical protein